MSAAPSRRIVIALWLVALLAGAFVVARTTFSADLSAFLPSSPNAQQRALIEQLRSGGAARTLFIAIEGGDATQRAAASRALAAALRAGGLFEAAHNGEQASWQSALAWLVEHRYRLSAALTPERFSVAGLRDAIDETLSQLGTPAGAAVAPLLERDPTGETSRIVESLLPARAPRSEGGLWVARAAPRALLLATTRAGGDDLDAQATALAQVRAAFAPHAAAGLRLVTSGPAQFAVASRDRIRREVTVLAGLGTLLMGGVLLLAFASASALAIALLPVATGIVAGIVAVGLAFGHVHGMTLGFGSTLIGEAVDYAIYYLIQARDGGWQRWRRDNWPTVRLGLLTSICGFGALVASGFPGLAQLGVFSIAGLVAAALTTRYVLPALAPNGAAGVGLRRGLARLAAHALHALPRWRWPVLVAGALAALLLAAQGARPWRADLASLSPVPLEQQQLDTALRADLGASDGGVLVVAQGADQQAALRAAEAAGARLDALVDAGVLAGYDTPARLLPSRAAQQARLASVPEADELRARLAQATAGGPLPASRLGAFITEVQAAKASAPITRESLTGSALAPLVDGLLSERRAGGWTALLPLQPSGPDVDVARLRSALGDLPAVQVIDIKHELDALYAGYLREALAQVLLGALAVALLLAWQLRSARRWLAVCRPLALAVLLTLAALVLFDVALGILHLIGLLLVIAIGSNYTLFFDRIERSDGRDHDDTLASLLLANLTTVLSFGLLALSQLPALSALGRVVAPGALLALVLAAVYARRRV